MIMSKKRLFLHIALLICIVFVSCSPQRRLTNLLTRYPDLIDTNKVVTTIYKDTTIFVPVLGTDTVYKYGTIRDTVFASSGTAHSYSYIYKDTLKLIVWQSDTTLTFRIDSAIRELQIKDTEIYTIQQKCDKSKTERVIDKLIAFVVIVFGGWLIINLIKLFK